MIMTVGSEIQGTPQPDPNGPEGGEHGSSTSDPVGDAAARGNGRPIDTLAALARHLLGARGALAVEYHEDDAVRVISSVGDAPLQLGEVIPTQGYLPRRVHPRGLLVIRDFERHRAADCDHVLPGRGVRALLGAPICGANGPVGVMCVLDGDARDWTPAERETMRALASAASNEGILPAPWPIPAADTPDTAAASGNPPASTSSGPESATSGSSEYATLLGFFDDDPTPGVIATGRGEIIRCNAGFARLVGFGTADDARGHDLAHLARTPETFARILRRLERGEVVQAEPVQLRRLDGEPVDAVASMVGTLDGRGQLTAVRALFIDKRRTERAPRQPRELFGLAEIANQDVVWVWDIAEERLDWSNGGPRRFRYAPEEMRHGIDWHVQRIHPEDRDSVVRAVDAALQGLDTVWTAEYRFRRGDGSYASVLDRAFIVRGDRGEPLRVIGWMLDVSQWREAESAHRFLVDASRILESTLDLEDALEGIARATVGFMGDYCRLDLLDGTGELRWMASHPPLEGDDEGSTIDFLRRISGRPDIDPLRTVLGEQETVLIPAARDGRGTLGAVASPAQSPGPGVRALLLVPITNRSGTVGLLTLARSAQSATFQPVDLIRARELARLTGLAVENCRLYQTAQQALSDREELLRFVSHDLRNPLHAIVSALGLAREGGEERGRERRRWLDPIERAVEQMRQLVENLLDTASIEAGNFTLRRSWNSPEKLATTACDVLRPMAETKGIELACTVDPGVPQVWIDFQQFLRVLSNLLVNALKFTGSGGNVHLHVGSAGSEVLISVADSGPGIPEEELEAVFTRYWQGRRGDRRGAGLGLAIARAIVQAHGGRVWAESRSGQGATFFATIPVTDEPPPRAPSNARARRHRRRSS